MNILVAEDTEDSRVFLKDYLEACSYSVFAAANGADALEILRRQKIDLVITDILMPVLDGYELCREIKKDPSLRTIPVIFYTATYTDERDKTLGLSLGADRFLIKPFEPSKLLANIQDVLRESAIAKPMIDERDAAIQHAHIIGRKLDKKLEELNQQRRQNISLTNQLERITDALPVLISQVDRDLRYRYVNSEYERWHKLPREQIVGKSVKDLLGSETFSAIEPYLKQAFSGNRVFYEREVTFHNTDQTRYIQVQYIPNDDNGGVIDSIYVVVTDLTEKHKADLEAEKIRKRLEQSQRLELIGQLTGGIAHDFNNLLTTILGYSGLGLAGLPGASNDSLRSYFANIENAGLRGRELVGQLLTFCRGSGTNAALIGIKPELDDIMKLLIPTMPSSISITLDIPESGPDLWINQGQLSQMIINLCINARDAMNNRGNIVIGAKRANIERRVCSSCLKEIDGDFVEIFVEDNGPGVPDDLKTKIFTPFFTTKPEGKGSGMGLAMVHGIVHEFGGHILVDSSPAEGTRFRLLFPATLAMNRYQGNNLQEEYAGAVRQIFN